jgi:hypothetical protein
MIDFLNELLVKGITEETVMPDSIRGSLSEDSFHQTKWKTYYQSANHPRWGVLLISEPDRVNELVSELANTRKLESHGFHVPKMGDEVHLIVNQLNGPNQVLAVIVEHVKGVGPFKATTSPKSVMRYISGLDEPARSSGRAAWISLRNLAKTVCPMDLQIMVASDGTIIARSALTFGLRLSAQGRRWPTLLALR